MVHTRDAIKPDRKICRHVFSRLPDKTQIRNHQMTTLAIISFRILYGVDGIYLELSISELQHLGLIVKFDLSVLFQFWWIESLIVDAKFMENLTKT